MGYINITDAEFPTDIEMKSGMINPTKSNYYLPLMFFWILVGILSRRFASGKTSKKQALIALLISLATTYFVIYYLSM